MFEVGDRIQVDKGVGRISTATILEIYFDNSTYRAKVKRDDNGQDDVFVWNIYQDEISVRKITESNVPIPTAAELNDRDRWLNARRAWKKMRDKDSKGPFISSIELLDNYFHYPLDGEQPTKIEEETERQNEQDRERERQWYVDMGDRLSE